MPDNRETLNEIHHIAEAVVTLVNGTALPPDLLAESVAPLLRALAVLGQKLGDRGENEQLIREITESALRLEMWLSSKARTAQASTACLA